MIPALLFQVRRGLSMGVSRCLLASFLGAMFIALAPAQVLKPVPTQLSFEPKSSDEISRRMTTHDDSNVVSITVNEDATLRGCKTSRTCEVDYAADVVSLARKQVPTGKKLTVLLFVHGWKHDSSWQDENYQNFREAIDCLNWGSSAYQAAYKTVLENDTDSFDHISCKGLPVQSGAVYLGIYVGWQGRRLNGNRSEFTLKDRYATALKTASGQDILTIFQRIHDASKEVSGLTGKARLVYMGHSFGGLIVEKVASRILTPDYLASHTQLCLDGKNGPAPYAELFLLVNPASTGFEGTHLIQTLKKANFCQNADISKSLPAPWIVSIHSNSDIATGRGGVWLRTFLSMERGWNLSDLDPVIRTKYIRSSTLNNELFATNVCYLDGTSMRADGRGYRTGSEYCEPIVSRVDVAKGLAFGNPIFSAEQRVQSYYDDPAILDGAFEIVRESCGPTTYSPDRASCTNEDLTRKHTQLVTMKNALSDLLAFTPIDEPEPNHLLNLYKLPDPDDLWNNTPYWVVNVSDLMIQGHSGFWNNEFTDFAGAFISRIPDVP